MRVNAPLAAAGLSLLLAVQPSPARAEQRASELSPSQLAVTPSILDTWSCRGDSELFTYFVRMRFRARNLSASPIWLPIVDNVVGRIRLARTAADAKAGKFNTNVDIDDIVAAGSRPGLYRAADFLLIPPSVERELPLEFRVAMPALMPGVRFNGLTPPGETWVSLVWTPWPSSRREAERWRRALEPRGIVMTTAIETIPIPIEFPEKPAFRSDCGVNGTKRR